MDYTSVSCILPRVNPRSNMNILHVSDIHMGSGFAHGRINPLTGLNTRLEDFGKSLATCIDRAITDQVDLVMFGGDAFPDATPAPYIQEVFASEFRRLVDHQIPLILLVGNHDQHAQGQGGASLSIYRTLGVPGVIVADKLATHRIETKNGCLQILSIPWINRSALLTRPESEKLSLPEINDLLLSRLEPALEGEIRRLDASLPTVVLGHLMADNAKLGAEKLLAVGRGFTMPLSMLVKESFDYVALGHVHRHQNLNPANDPPVVYPGSIDRVDFSEEKEDKGYVMIQIQPGAALSERAFQVNWEFCPLPVRPFLTIKVNASKDEDPQAKIIKAIKKGTIEDAVVRLIYQVESQQTELIQSTEFHELLAAAHSYTIQAELVSQLMQPRLPELGETAHSPIDALTTYLEHRTDLAHLSTAMMLAAHELMSEQAELLESIG
jgi:DNA repair protein SbcD/Mre11